MDKAQRAANTDHGLEWETGLVPQESAIGLNKQGPALIVIVDDEPEVLAVLASALTLPEFECHTFEDPIEALRQIILFPPAVIIIDRHMPTMPGLDLCAEVREKLGSGGPPMIMISGDDHEDTITKAYEAGASDYLTKPIKIGLLRTKIRNLIGTNFKAYDPAEVTPRTIGCYQVISEIGRGGMGVVYRVRHPDQDRDFALKTFVTSTHDVEGVLRFRREIDVMLELTHPNIIKVYETGMLGRAYYYVMDYIEGGALADRIENVGALPASEVATTCYAIADALGYIHNHGLVHRDVKPANILLSAGRGPILTDFGLSKNVVDRQITKVGYLLGTPHFMSPEMIRGDPVDHRADLFALGMVALEMLCGKMIIADTNPYRAMRRIVTRRFPLASQLTLAAPASPILLHAIDRLLALNPEQRFQDALAFMKTIEPILPTAP